MVIEDSLTDPLGNFFTVKDKESFIKSVNNLVCGQDECTDENALKNVPDFKFKMTCDSSKDRISSLDMKLEGALYSWFNQKNKRIEYLIGELSNPIEGEQVLGLGRLFFSKYELFMRTDYSKKKDYEYSVGFGDLDYKVNTTLWYIISAIVFICLMLTMVFSALFPMDRIEQASDLISDKNIVNERVLTENKEMQDSYDKDEKENNSKYQFAKNLRVNRVLSK